MKKQFIVFLSLLLVFTSQAQLPFPVQFATSAYQVDTIAEWDWVTNLMDIQKEELLSSESDNDDISQRDSSFASALNMGTMLLLMQYSDTSEFSNAMMDSIVFPCDCIMAADTFGIIYSIGFMGGTYGGAKVYGLSFESFSGEWIDEPGFLYYSLTDTLDTQSVIMGAQNQSLVFRDAPTFQIGDMISGKLTHESAPYYVRSGDMRLAERIKFKMYFKCTLRNNY